MLSFMRSVAEWLHILTPEPPHISRPEPPHILTPEHPSLLCKPTRDITWSELMRDELLKSIQSFKPEAENAKAANILLLGHIGSGKSSFVNSINMVFSERLMQVAQAGTGGKSFTTKLGCHYLETVKGKALPVKLYDTRGLEADDDDIRIHEDDLLSTIMGHVRINYEYNPSCEIKDDNPKYRKDPKFRDRMHCVVYVINGRQVSVLLEPLVKKYRNLRKRITKEGIPQVVILTHCDVACTEVEKDLTMVFRSKDINEKMNKVSMTLGIPLHYVFPVKNYSTEVETSPNMDILLLSTFKHMINFAGDFIKMTTRNEEEEEDD